MRRLRLAVAVDEDRGTMILKQGPHYVADVEYIRGLTNHPDKDREDIQAVVDMAAATGVQISPPTSEDNDDLDDIEYQVLEDRQGDQQEGGAGPNVGNDDGEEADPEDEDEDGNVTPRRTRGGTVLGGPPPPPKKRRKTEART